MMEAFLTYS